MRKIRLLVPGLALAALTFSGCWLISGQFTVSEKLPDPLTIGGVNSLVSAQIDLTTNGDYKDHKKDLKDLADCALLGKFTNNTSTALDVEVWLTPGLTAFTTETAVTTAGVLVWGPFRLAGNASRVIGWDESAKLFSNAGKAALLSEVKGDGQFTLYAKGKNAPYAFTITQGVAVVVIDAGK